MQGPRAATISPRLAPSRPIASTVAPTTPASAPFQPACAAPMTRALVGEQDHAAVRARHAEGEARARRHERVAARARARLPKLRDCDRVGRVNLVRHSETLRRDAEGDRDPAAVLRHRVWRVARADAAVKRCVDAFRDSAEAREKAMRDAGKPERLHGQELRRAHADFELAGWKPGGGRSLRSAIAIALKRAPISP